MKFNLSDFLELDTTALLAVNGGSDCGGGTSPSTPSPSSGGPSTPHGGGGSNPGSGTGSGGGYCSGASDGKTVYPNPYYKNGGKNSTPTGTAGGNCGNISGKNDLPQTPDAGKNVEDSTSKLAKVADGIAYPVGDEYSDDFVVTDVFGPREPINTLKGKTKPFHTGIDIAAPEGTRINSIGDGVVSEIGTSEVLGNYVIVTHPNRTSTRYAHCSEITTGVGSVVSAGQQIGCVGTTGMSTGSHLHLSYDGNCDGEYTSCEADNPNYLLSR